jgi:hypothetical protein
MVGGVLLALVATGAAGCCAGFDRGPDYAEIGRGLADHDAAGRLAEVCAVEVESNAVDQLLQVVLAEVRVGAAGAGSGTLDAVLNAAQERVAIKAARLWMRVDYFLNRHFLSSLLPPGSPARFAGHDDFRAFRRLIGPAEADAGEAGISAIGLG